MRLAAWDFSSSEMTRRILLPASDGGILTGIQSTPDTENIKLTGACERTLKSRRRPLKLEEKIWTLADWLEMFLDRSWGSG